MPPGLDINIQFDKRSNQSSGKGFNAVGARRELELEVPTSPSSQHSPNLDIYISVESKLGPAG